MELYFIRHGRQNSRLCNVDVELSTEGICQADLLGKRLAYAGIDVIYSSDMVRAVQTAQIVNLYCRVEHVVYPELREINFGKLEGLSDEVIAKEYREFQLEQDKMETDLPYPDGECSEDVYRRMIPVIEKIVQTDDKNADIITHGGVIRSFVSAILGMGFEKKLLLAKTLENSSITKINYNKEKNRFYLDSFNDYGHLEQTPELLRENWL